MTVRAGRRRQRASSGSDTTYDRILAETMRLIARDGVEELKIKDIADAVGVRMPSLYKHFDNRDAIIAELSRRMVHDVAVSLQPDGELPAEEWIRSWARRLVGFYAERPAYVRLVLRDLATPGGYKKISDALGPVADIAGIEPLKSFTEEFDHACRRGVRSGVLRRIDRSSFLSTMFGMVLVSLAWPYSGRAKAFRTADIERLKANAADVAWELVRARGRNA